MALKASDAGYSKISGNVIKYNQMRDSQTNLMLFLRDIEFVSIKLIANIKRVYFLIKSLYPTFGR